MNKKFKQLIPVTNDYAVLATRMDHFNEPCYDRKLDGRQYFWAILDRGNYLNDEIVLIDVTKSGAPRICERNLVVEKITCPICGQKMFPKYDRKRTPNFWQDCLGCGYMLDTSMDAEDSGGSHVQAMMKGGEPIDGWKPVSLSVEGT